jgi:hypothetical protein
MAFTSIINLQLALFTKVTDYLECSFVELQNKTNSDNCYESP